uniref:Mitochondrial carrier protein n=1 Tax=Polytomella parva TaxID=51329 RepID=A0A7S0V8U3_9CHLO|mmetsp:Transcript_30314/g.55393  ORF Transcript_30314/g.55393 Transcript_30314/m.55393 type:complete len:471 (+) Transcript_30314:90-1502(+)
MSSSDAKQNSSSPENGQSAEREKPNMFATAFSGAFSAALVGVALQPLDVVKTRMQADASQGITRGFLDTLNVVLKDGGGSMYTLWRGSEAGVIRVALGAGMQFLILEQLKFILTQSPTSSTKKNPANLVDNGSQSSSSSNSTPSLTLKEQRLDNWGAAIAGGVSRAVAATLVCPLTTIKTRMEFVSAPGAVGAPERYASTWQALEKIVRTEGPQALFRGMIPTIISNAPYSGLYYVFYTRLREAAANQIQRMGDEVAAVAVPLKVPNHDTRTSSDNRSSNTFRAANKEGPLLPSLSPSSPSPSSPMPSKFVVPQAVINFSCGLLASIAATIITQPFDVIRTHAQLVTNVGKGLSVGSAGVAGGSSAMAAALAALSQGSKGAIGGGGEAAKLMQTATVLTTMLKLTGIYPIMDLMATRGPRALLSGSVPRLMKRMTQSALVWTMYEELVPRVTALAIASKEDMRRWQRRKD